MSQKPSDDSIAFWSRYLHGAPPVLDLPVARSRRQQQPYEAGELTFRPETGPGVDARLFEQRLLAALLVVLHRYSGQSDLLVGIDGSFVDPSRSSGAELVALRIDLGAELTGSRLLERLSGRLEACRPHLDVGFAAVLAAIGIESGSSHHPLVQVVCARAAAGGAVDYARREPGAPPPDLSLVIDGEVIDGQVIDGTDDAARLHLRFNALLFDEHTIGRLAAHIDLVLAALAETPDRSLRRLALVTGDELVRITRQWNDTAVEFPAERCLHQLFEDSVDRSPEATAAICGSDSLSYRELEERSNRLANHLRGLGVGPNQPVGICVERSLEMVVGLVAIAKAGGAYLPLDPSYPPERLAWMLADARLAVALTLDRLTDRLPEADTRLVRLDAQWEEIAAAAAARPDSGVTPDDLAYVIYTSGSTGNPKGVVLDHRGRVNNFTDFNRRFSVGAGDRLIALSSLSFDMTAYDVFGGLAAGATIVMPAARFEREPSHWAHLIRGHQVTIWHSAPAMLEMLVENVRERSELHPTSLRLCLLGGDWIPVSLPDRLRKMAGDLRVISLGGATEASMDSTIYEVETTDPEWTSIPYGRPMANQLAYVVGRASQPQPIGVPGELHLGGVGVAWGYLERPELTAEKFVPNPFSGVPGDRMYRTGDLARYRQDGNLELLGRIDYQVKIRGHRIELGEIEATMKEHPAVREAVVVAKGDRGSDKRLVGYVVPELASDEPGGGLEWDKEQVDQWQAVYDETYGQQAEQADPTFNIIGWNSSYTGLPIPDEEMLEWVEATVQRILSLRPRRVLEIGCGTGLMLFRVAPYCERYVGTDLSAVGLESIRRQLAERSLDQVELRHQLADDFDGLEPRSFDLVILNSITQLFPSVSYLLDVLDGAVERIAAGGFLFVGDNRDLRLAEHLHASIQLSQAPASVPRDDLPERVEQSMAQEEQLLLDPTLFQALPNRLPRLSSVTAQLKRGRHQNELNRFRFDVIAAVDGSPDSAAATSHSWRDGDDLDTVRRLLAERPEALAVSGVPNARLTAPALARSLIADPSGLATASAMRQALRSSSAASPSSATTPSSTAMGVDPESFWSLGAEASYEVFVGHSAAGPESFDAIFRLAGSAAAPPAMPVGDRAAEPWASYGNQPLSGRLNLRLPGQVREFLGERLPDYMIPANVVLLDALPLSPNGKVDRKSLPEPEMTRPELDAPLVPPRGALEQVLTSIWEETLGLDNVGVRDGFLELGGHSLLATQIQSRIHELFPVEIPLRHFFGALTIEGLADTLRQVAAGAGADVEGAAELVLQYSGLSVEELESALEADVTSEPQP